MGNLIKETPFSEVTATLEVLDRYGVGREHLTLLRSDSAFAARIAKTLLDSSGIDTKGEIFPITVDYDRHLDRMIADGKYDWKSPDIGAVNFPLDGKGQFEMNTISTPQLVPVFRQVVRLSGLATLKRKAVPVAILISPQVRLVRLKPAGKVTERVLEVVPEQGGEEQAWLTRLFCTVKAMVWFEVAEVAALVKVSERLVTWLAREVSIKENQKRPREIAKAKAKIFLGCFRITCAMKQGRCQEGYSERIATREQKTAEYRQLIDSLPYFKYRSIPPPV